MISRIVSLFCAFYGAGASLSQLSAKADQLDANFSKLISDGIHMKSGEQVMVTFTGLSSTQYD